MNKPDPTNSTESAEQTFAMPKMSWEQGTPQQQILDYVREMKRGMASLPDSTGFGGRANNAVRDAYADAYATVESHIVEKMKLWELSHPNRPTTVTEEGATE